MCRLHILLSAIIILLCKRKGGLYASATRRIHVRDWQLAKGSSRPFLGGLKAPYLSSQPP